MGVAKIPTFSFGVLAKMLYLDFVKSSLNLLGRSLRTSATFGLLLGFLALSCARAEVVLNEIMASNGSSVPNGVDFPDWVEIYNPGPTTANIGGYGLTDTVTNAFKYRFPSPTQIPAGKYLIIWCDNNTNSPGMHSGFSFKQSGETITLYNGSGLTVDSVQFGPQITDMTIGRIPNGSGPWTLTKPTPDLANAAAPLGNVMKLRINEWMALEFKSDGVTLKPDWFEVYNPDTNVVAMSGIVFTDSTNAPPATNQPLINLYFIPARGFYQFFADDKISYNNVNFKLSSTTGDQISMYASNKTTLIHKVVFGAQTANTSQGLIPDGNTNNIIFFRSNQPSPAASNFLPITNVVVSEFLTHTDDPWEDAIELLNISSSPADISYFWLSNSPDEPQKYRIPAGTIIPPGGRKVFYEYRPPDGVTAVCNNNMGPGFNTSGLGDTPCFTLNSAHGDQLYIHSGDASGNLTGSRKGLDFGAADHGFSFGRYVTSDGNVDYPIMSSNTFGVDNPTSRAQFRTGTGLPNAYPRVGPIVINEVMYHPPNIYTTNLSTIITNDDSVNEFIELHNITATNVFLHHPVETTNTWKLDDAVTFVFPPGALIPANGFLLVVNFSPATNADLLVAFKNLYGIPSSFTNIYGPYGGKLQNSGASIKLYKPDFVQDASHPDAGFLPYVLMDKVSYSDSGAWPTAADGQGASLQRRHRAEYGNDPINWFAQGPTPGRTNNFVGPLRASSIVRGPGTQTALGFQALQGQSYVVEYKDSLSAVVWNTLVNVPPQTQTTTYIARDFGFSPTGNRFYRISTPTYP
ncbi:MAG: Spore coat protein CotH [Verrucomicrobiales bacterium]|nr:Spore coat protein CotH [Verrucomicrobiales bacterium]